jgi:hypothetical protein
LLPKLKTILPVSGEKGQHVFVASATASTSQMLANELGISGDEGGELPMQLRLLGATKLVVMARLMVWMGRLMVVMGRSVMAMPWM